uniref:Uncharacterized protein n=1 Tax=Cacopsylla melanoneura TaxID=428564 RepID=A0A8D9BBQ9_9HEMI
MKKRSGVSGPVSGTDDSLAGSEIDINMKSTLDSFSLHTYPSVSSLSKYPSMSTLSSISFDDSVVSWAIPRPDDEKPDMTDIVSVDMSDIDIGDMLDAEEDKVDQYDMVNDDKELDGKQIVTNNTLNPLVDRSNEVSSTDLPQIARVTLVELRGKSFKKIHEENMKRRMLLP